MTKEEAIKTLRELWRETNDPWYEEVYNMAIEALSAERTGEWIPVSERLPEDGIAVLITTENEEVYIDQVITDPYKERYFQSNTGYDNFQVIAWQPRPEPYKGGDTE